MRFDEQSVHKLATPLLRRACDHITLMSVLVLNSHPELIQQLLVRPTQTLQRIDRREREGRR